MTFIHKLCETIGENNKPIYTVMAIACGKGTVRPILSITDKKEAPDARKYAALRELMTEFIGVPTTLAFGLLGEQAAKSLTQKGTIKYKRANAVMSFFGICLAAGYFVPKFCNIFMPHVMKKLMPNYDPNAVSAPMPNQRIKSPSKTKSVKSLNSYPPYTGSIYHRNGMKVV